MLYGVAKTVNTASEAFWITNAICSVIVAGGRVWIHLTDSPLKVSELLGTVGKATFRRQAAVAILTCLVTNEAMKALLEKTPLKKSPIVTVLSLAVGIAAGAAAASALTHPVFTFLKVATVASMITLALAKEMLPQMFIKPEPFERLTTDVK